MESRRRRRGASKHSSAVSETISARTKTWVGLWAAGGVNVCVCEDRGGGQGRAFKRQSSAEL